MTCNETRERLLELRRGTLDHETRASVEAHLVTCEACRREDAADRALDVVLRDKLPKRRAPDSLRQAIEAQLDGRSATPNDAAPRRRRAKPRLGVVAIVSAAVLAAAAAVALTWKPRANDPMVAEAVNDHLRVLYSEHPIEVESGGVHQVKPWFEGRVDFAPTTGFGGDDDFPLQGGSIAYFIDRKAAAYVYKRRLHVITLFVYRADGLPWPAAPSVPLGHVRATEQTTRGFHVLLWRDGDLGYSLVSDMDPHELETLGARIAGP